jgi:hypothetical protein
MKGLILKDLYNLRKYGKTLLLISAFYIMLSFMMESESMFTGMIVIMFAITSVTSFAYDSQSGWDVYVHTLPVTRKDVVTSKYLLSYLLALTGGLLALLMGWINGLLKNISNFTETLIAAYALFAVGIIFISILLPLVYKFGVERSRVIVLAVIALPTAAFLVLAQTGTVVAPDEQTIRQVLLFSPVVVIVCGVLSFMISHTIYRRKEV